MHQKQKAFYAFLPYFPLWQIGGPCCYPPKNIQLSCDECQLALHTFPEKHSWSSDKILQKRASLRKLLGSWSPAVRTGDPQADHEDLADEVAFASDDVGMAAPSPQAAGTIHAVLRAYFAGRPLPLRRISAL